MGKKYTLRACLILPQSIWIKGVSIPSKSKSLLIHINPLWSIWIENNRTSPQEFLGSPQGTFFYENRYGEPKPDGEFHVTMLYTIHLSPIHDTTG
jgi:hypothetical protein